MKFIVTGDIHGNFSDIFTFADTYPEDYALIILGDAGFNFYLNKTDEKLKEKTCHLEHYIYCVRGNHEERPELLPTMVKMYDSYVDGYVWFEPEYPHISYFIDGEVYNIEGYKCLVIGGAYSVDKYYRLQRAQLRGIDIENHWTGWFKNEQLTKEEMDTIMREKSNQEYDFILTHTCPYSWQPFDKFIAAVDQKTVDNTMENWMQEFAAKVKWNYAWLFGHFHDDRIVRPHVEMLFNNYIPLSEIAQRWTDWENGYKPTNYYISYDTNWPFWTEELRSRKYKNVST